MSCRCYLAPSRHIMLLLIFSSITICFAHRVLLNLAITEMVEGEPGEIPCVQNNKIPEIGGNKRKLSQFAQSVVLLSLYPTWTIFYVPAQIFCKKYGGRCPAIMGVVISTFGTGISPVVASYLHWGILAIVRAFMGCGQALVFAACTDLCSKWMPLDSRVNFCRLRFASSILGIIIGTLLTGVVMHTTLNWIYAYYFWCAVGSIWVLFGFVLVYNEPGICPYISSGELTEILRDKSSYQIRPLTGNVPFKDSAVWALVAAHFGNNFLFYAIFTNMPKHIKDVVKLNSKENTLASTAPYFGILLGYLIATEVSIKLMKKNINVSIIFKINIFLGTVVSSGILNVLRIDICDKYFISAVVTAALFFNGTCQFVIDEGCNSRSIYNYDYLYAVVTCFGSIPASITPLIIGELAVFHTEYSWDWISNIILAVCICCCLFFFIFGSGRRAKWDYSETDLWNVPPPKHKKWYLQNEES